MRVISRSNVAVVGGAGFLGSHLVDYLINNRQCQVVVVDNLAAGRREYIHRYAEFVHHDISQSETFLFNLFEKRKIEYVFNYAAWPYVPDSFDRPLHVFATNATGAMHVINAATAAGCKGILQVSSAELYGGWQHNGQPDGRNSISEEDPVRPHSTYGAAKAAVDYYCQAAWQERRSPVITLRQFNCVGERETHPYVVPEIIKQLSTQFPHERAKFKAPEPPVVLLGNNSRRDFMYAGDAVRIATHLLERGKFGQVYNLGSEQSVEIYELARLVAARMGFKDVQVVQDKARVRPWEIWHLQSNNSKIRGAVGDQAFENMVALSEALDRTISHYLLNGRRWCWE